MSFAAQSVPGVAAPGAPPGGGSPAGRGVLVELRDLRRSFGDVHALDGMDLTINPGEMVVLLGPSGCGKTTALRVLAGLEDADSGQVRVGGRDISGVPTNRRDMGMVFQAYSLFPHLTSLENVAFGLRLRGQGAAQRRRVAGEYLDLVGLSAQADRYASQLSGGQQQRVALARALAIHPQVLLLDEPLSALDAKVRVQLRGEIQRIQRDVGITTLFVTHDQEEALAVADRVGVMQRGRIVQIAAPEQLYSRPADRFVAEFIGLSNPLPGNASGDTATVLGQRVPLLPGSPRSGPVTVLIRPEAVRLGRPDGPGGGDAPPAAAAGTSGGVPATVAAVSFLGASGHADVRLADGTVVTAHVASSEVAALRVGQPVTVHLPPVPALAVPAES